MVHHRDVFGQLVLSFEVQAADVGFQINDIRVHTIGVAEDHEWPSLGRIGFRVLKNKVANAFAEGKLQWQEGAGFVESP